MNMRLVAIAALMAIWCQSAIAGTVSSSATVTRNATPLVVNIIGFTVDCSWAAGTTVATLSTSGGNGKPVVYTFGGTAPVDLVISGNFLKLGSTGIAPANCGTTEPITINATQ